MSWQTYVDSNLIGTGKIKRAVIIGHKGGVWAKSAGYELSSAEQKALIKAHDNPTETLANGIRLAGQKFFAVQCDERSVYGKKQADGCILVKTKQAILIAEYAHPVQGPEVIPIVEALADYLISTGY